MKKLFPFIIAILGMFLGAVCVNAQEVRALPNATSADSSLIQVDTRADWPGASQDFYHNYFGKDSLTTTFHGRSVTVYWSFITHAYSTADRKWYIEFGHPSKWYYWNDDDSSFHQEGT
jgi:hypothetical protein